MRGFTVAIYTLAFSVLVVSLAMIPQEEYRYMNLSEKLALGFSVIVGFSGILLSYYSYVDGKILTTMQARKNPEKRQDRKDQGDEHDITFTMAHVRVDQLDRPQLAELKSKSANNQKKVVKDIVSEAHTLTKHEYLETTSAGNISVEILSGLAETLGSDFEVLQGSISGKGSVLYIKRADYSP